MSQLKLNGTRVAKALLFLPWHGAWTADVMLDSPIEFPTRVTLTIGAAPYVGTVYRAGNYLGSYRARLVGGADGWGKTLGARGYYNPLGIPFSLILADLERETGETIELGSDFVLGQHYARRTGPASDALNGRAWYVDPTGVTQIRERDTSGRVTSSFALTRGSNYADGRIVVATESPEDWIPGRRFSSPVLSERRISSVGHRFDAAENRTIIWTTNERLTDGVQ